MAFPQGIYFRATDDQSDPSDHDAEISAVANYPRTSAQGNSVGWENAGGDGGPRDRNTTTDVRLKGLVFVRSASNIDYRIDLPATGDYRIRAALGDGSFARRGTVQFLDGTTVFATPQNDSVVDTANWIDASGVTRTSEADWVNNNATITRTFASTIFRVRLSDSVAAPGESGPGIAALYIEAVGGGGGGTTSNVRRSG